MPAVWKAARKRFSAPDGPDWMSEEAWADLLFGHNCQVSFKYLYYRRNTVLMLY